MTTDKPQLDATEILQALSDLRRALRRLAIEPPDAIEFEPDAWSRVVHLIRRSFQGLALPPPPPSDLKSLSVMGIEIRRTDASRPEPETAAIESLLAEKAELRAQLAIESKARDALLLENETLRKDAERYRWLRGECYTLTKHAAVTYTDQNEHVAMWCKEHVRENTSAAVDAAVDADRAAAKEKP